MKNANTEKEKKKATSAKTSKPKDRKKKTATTRSKKSITEEVQVKRNALEKEPIEKEVNQPFSSLIIIMIVAIIILLTSSYGFFTYQRSGKTPNVLYTADLSIILDESASLGINQQNAFPVYDEVGRTTDPYKFTLKNLGAVEANYKIKLVADVEAQYEDGCSDNLLADESVKFQLIKDGSVVKEDLLSNLEDYVIDVGFIGTADNNKSYDYELRLWITSEAGKEVMGRHYHGKIEVEVIDPANS